MASTSSPLHDYIAGAVGGMAGLVVGHPFDTTKVRGFFRGMAFPLLSYGAVNSVFFGVYGNTLKLLQPIEKAGQQVVSYGQVYVAGCVGGAVQLAVACPVEVVKVVLQSQIPASGAAVSRSAGPAFKGSKDCLVSLIKERGFAACYKGLAVMAVRDIPTYGLYMAIYQWSYDQLMALGSFADQQGILASLVAGAVTGSISWTICLPVDVVKSLIQASAAEKGSTPGWLECAQKLYRLRGIRGFFTGIQVTVIRATLVNAVTFLTYSQSLEFLGHYDHVKF